MDRDARLDWLRIAVIGLRKMKQSILCVLLIFCMYPTNAGILDATKDLEGKVVVYAGEIEELYCPVSGKYDCVQWPTNFLKFQYRDICFTSEIGSCNLLCKGFIAVGKDKVPYLFIVEKIGGSLKKFSVNYYECPDLY